MHHDLCDLESQIQIRILPKERTLSSRINLIAYAFSRVQADVYLKQHSVSCVWPLPECITLVFKAYFWYKWKLL